MTKLSKGAVATAIWAMADNHNLTTLGWTIRHIEEWANCPPIIIWDVPDVSKTDLPA